MVLLAYFLRDWSLLQLSFAIISIGLVSIYFLVPESPRWLLNHGKIQLAEANLRIIARRNRVDLEKSSFDVHFKILKEVHGVGDRDKYLRLKYCFFLKTQFKF